MLCEQSSAFDPEELSLFGDIFDRTVASLPATMRTTFNRAEIAKNILRRAAAGERCGVVGSRAPRVAFSGRAATRVSNEIGLSEREQGRTSRQGKTRPGGGLAANR